MDLENNPRNYKYSTISELIRKKGRNNPEKELLIEANTRESVTYGEALESALGIAAAFDEIGVQKGGVVATVLPNSIRHALVWFGCMLKGAVFAPINVNLTPTEIEHCLNSIEPDVLILEEKHLEGYDRISNDVIDIENKYVNTKSRGDFEGVDSLMSGNSIDRSREITPDNPAIICFTGGTTGMPKPVLLPHFAPLSGAYRYNEWYDILPEDIHMTFLKLYHIGGQQFGVLGPMMADITSVIMNEFSASNYFEQITEHQATIIDPLGPAMKILLKTYEEPVENSARLCVTGGSLDREQVTEFTERFGVTVHGGYALTEGGGIKLLNIERPIEDRQKSDVSGTPIGVKNDWAEIAILDENNSPVEDRTVGELCLRPTIPHTMMKRYYDQPENTIELWDGLWIHTGDKCLVDADGLVYFVGRSEYFIRRKGENISVHEVESVLNSHPEVEESAVVGIPDDDIGENIVKAFVVTDSFSNKNELHDFCRSKLAGFKRPQRIEFIDELPRSSTKEEIQRHALTGEHSDECG